MPQSAEPDELSRLEAQMKALLAESDLIQRRIFALKNDVTGVVDDRVLIAEAEIVRQAGEQTSEQL
jgi:hypothetical protein